MYIGQTRVTQAVHLRNAMYWASAVGECWVWGVGVRGMAPASITAVHCAMAIQYSLPR